MVLAGLWKLISRSFLIMVFVMLTPRLILYPIFDYFYLSSNSETVYSSPLSALEVIVFHRKKLVNLETELNDYLSPNGRQDISELLNRATAINLHSDGNPRQTVQDDQRLVQERHSLLENFDMDKFLRLYSIGDRLSSVSNKDAVHILGRNFELAAKHGVYLDRHKKLISDEDDGDESGAEVTVKDGEETCATALEKLLILLQDGQKLTDKITKMAEEIEQRYEKGESVDDLDVPAQVENFNAESSRVKAEVDVIVRQNREALGKTREFISSATERVTILLSQFNSEWSQEIQKHRDLFKELTENQDGMDLVGPVVTQRSAEEL